MKSNHKNSSIQGDNNHPSHHASHTKCSKCCSNCRCCLILMCGPTRSSSRRRLWIIAVLFLITSYTMCLADVMTEYRWREHPSMILPDIGFDLADYATPSITKWIGFPDRAVTAFVVCTVLWIAVDAPRSHKLSVFRRLLTMVTILYFCRAICVIATQLPTPFHEDSHHDTWSNKLFYEALLVFFRQKTTNSDVFFSGHTVVLVTCACTVGTYCTRRWLAILWWLACLFSLYVIMATKFHYSIDILTGLVLSVTIWKMYHLAMRITEMRNSLPIFKLFESDDDIQEYSIHVQGTTPLLSHADHPHDSHYNLNDIMPDLCVTEPSREDTEKRKEENTPSSKLMDLLSLP